MAASIGIMLALAICAASTVIGFDRDRSFYATITIVIASYYVLFAVVGGSTHTLWRDGAVAALFASLAAAGFRTSLWLIVAALAGHGVMDVVHASLIANPGVPRWWPPFCAAFDLVAAAYLALLIVTGRSAARPDRQAGTGGSL